MLDGRLSLVTPEGIRLLLTPAGPYLRAVAWMLDFLVWAVAAGLLYAILPKGKLGEGLYSIALFVAYWGYPIISEVYFGGRTLGKRATGLEVVRADGLPVGWRESTLRNLLLVADFLPIFYMSGLLCMMLDVKFRRLGDIVAGTVVIHREFRPVRTRPPAAPPMPPPFPLNADQQRTLADLFDRESSLPIERMAELGTLAAPLTGRIGAASVEAMRGYVAGFTQ
ncbi:RDD family protein [Massilia sp. TSP1-1-2]|uniref:RDD family protein n=1 Tax=unclassified Massilia TaxID=2609279 RepID=UPI003CE9397F